MGTSVSPWLLDPLRFSMKPNRTLANGRAVQVDPIEPTLKVESAWN